MRDELNAAVKAAMKAGDKARLSTLRMIGSAIKDKDIAGRTSGAEHISDGEIAELLAKMVKSREDSAKLYDEGGRPELAAKEREEIAVIREYMPRQMDEAEAKAAIAALVVELGAAGPKDMGRASGLVKAALVG
ncbi:MAG: GatB/YqeY domain-containing protein [Siculibacillus sp.]|nr:GatB/YqeY domain-containing protein [Siculibacillus sp.]